MNNKIAIITARGGSKRIHKKNIKDFCGKPIIAYSIEAALQSKIFDEVMVSTDDEEIAQIAKKYGANVPFFRSKQTSDDFASTKDVLFEVLSEYKDRGKTYNIACCIYPTAPFITFDKLAKCIHMLEEKNADAVIPVVKFSFPPQRGLIISNEGNINFKDCKNRFTRSQDLESIYHDAGQFYCINVDSFVKQKCLIMENTLPFIEDDIEVQDIDNIQDWKLAELKYNLMKQKYQDDK